MNILVLEFVTSVGGVQTVYKNILPHLAKEHKIYFLDIKLVKNKQSYFIMPTC